MWASSSEQDTWLLFASHTCTLFRADNELASALQEGRFTEIPPEILDTLRRARFLLPTDTNERDLIIYWLNAEIFKDSDCQSVVICPTLECNFACPFCFESSQNDRRIMDERTMERLTALVQQRLTGKRSLEVTWYGGEPLLALDVIRQLSPKLRSVAREARKQYSSQMITTGYLLSASTVAELVLEHAVKFFQVTLVGPRDYHDKMRPLKGGQGTYDRILGNLMEIARTTHNIRVAVRLHFDVNNLELLSEIVKSLRENLDQRFVFTPAATRPYGDGFLQEEAVSEASVQAALIRAGRDEPSTYSLDHLLRIQFPKPFWAVACSAPRYSSLIVGPSGELYSCWEGVGKDEYRVGDLSSGLDPCKLLEWYRPGIPADCEGCLVLPICCGGCPDARRRGEVRCIGLRDNLRSWLELCDRLTISN